MTQDERNFRSAYYEKVGFKSVEERKSLEILLKDRTLDMVKLRQFCLRFSVPVIHRKTVWKLLLGIIPLQADSHSFVTDQRKQEYKGLTHALQVMKIVDNNTPKPQIFFAAWLLQSGNLRFDINLQTDSNVKLIMQVLLRLFDDDADIFWLGKQFLTFCMKFKPDIPKLIEGTHTLLEKEDIILYRHLKSSGILRNLPFKRWFGSSFAEVLNENSLARIWDKVCGGSCKILVFVIVVLLTNYRHKLLKCKNLESVTQCIVNLPEETADVIANKAIEMWQQHGSPLTVHDKPKP